MQITRMRGATVSGSLRDRCMGEQVFQQPVEDHRPGQAASHCPRRNRQSADNFGYNLGANRHSWLGLSRPRLIQAKGKRGAPHVAGAGLKYAISQGCLPFITVVVRQCETLQRRANRASDESDARRLPPGQVTSGQPTGCGCKPCRKSTAFDAWDAAVNTARLSSLRKKETQCPCCQGLSPGTGVPDNRGCVAVAIGGLDSPAQ